MSWLDEDRPGSGPVEGDGRMIAGVFCFYRNGRWVPSRPHPAKDTDDGE